MADTCPNCKAVDVVDEKCPRCGIVIPLYHSALEKMRRGPVAPTATAVSASAAPAVHVASPAPPPRTVSLSATTAAREIQHLSFHGTGLALFGIHVANVLRSLLTLGVYHFWAKVRVRRYVMSQTELLGDRFAYHGTGRELLLGFVKAMLFFTLPLLALYAVPLLDPGKPIEIAASLLAYAIAMVFVPMAMVGARRYRLSRTSFRSIRFSFRGDTWEFVRLFVGGTFLTILTLGVYSPIFQTRIQAFMTSHAYFGQRRFRFVGHGRELLGPYLKAIALTLPTLGLCWFWFVARKRRFFWERTAFEGARFRCTVTGRLLLALMAGNAAMLVLTLGLAWPWVLVRNARFALRHLAIEGALDLSGILQDRRAAPATGDVLSTFLGADVDLA